MWVSAAILGMFLAAQTDVASTVCQPAGQDLPPSTFDDCAQAQGPIEARACQQAIALPEPAAREGSAECRGRWLLGQANERAGRGSEAAAGYEEVGDSERNRGAWALAAEAYEKAIRLDPGVARLRLKLARSYFELGQCLGAVSERPMADTAPGRIEGSWYVLEAAPGKPGTFRVCGVASAVYQIHKALELGVEDPLVHRLRGDIWRKAGHYTEALSAYRLIEDKVPEAERAAFEYGCAQAAFGADDIETWIDRLRRAVELDRSAYGPLLLEGCQAAAARCNQRGDLAGYVRFMKLAVREAPQSADLRYRLGVAHWEAGRPGEAVEQWQTALELDPNHPGKSLMLERIRSVSAADRGG